MRSMIAPDAGPSRIAGTVKAMPNSATSPAEASYS
jgi:hypothetical protein